MSEIKKKTFREWLSSLDEDDYTPVVTMAIYSEYNQFSEATSVAILTAGLLGEQYIGLQPGFMDDSLEILQAKGYNYPGG